MARQMLDTSYHRSRLAETFSPTGLPGHVMLYALEVCDMPFRILHHLHGHVMQLTALGVVHCRVPDAHQRRLGFTFLKEAGHTQRST
jgi:hypothetical protein